MSVLFPVVSTDAVRVGIDVLRQNSDAGLMEVEFPADNFFALPSNFSGRMQKEGTTRMEFHFLPVPSLFLQKAA